MEWVLVALVLTGGNSSASHSYYIPTFAGEDLCREAAENMKKEFGRVGDVKVDVRTVCFRRNDREVNRPKK